MRAIALLVAILCWLTLAACTDRGESSKQGQPASSESGQPQLPAAPKQAPSIAHMPTDLPPSCVASS